MEEEREYELTNIATATAPAIKTMDGRVISMEEAIVEILNRVRKIERGVIG